MSLPEEKEWSVAAKLAFASFGEDLAALIRIKRKCRSAVLGHAGLKLEPKRFIESSCLCKGLFPDKEVERVHDLAQRDNVSLVNRWQMPDLTSSSGSLGGVLLARNVASLARLLDSLAKGASQPSTVHL